MNVRWLLCVAALFLPAALHGQDEADAKKVTYPAGYTETLDQTYVTVGDWAGKMDLYLPPKGTGPAPALIKIHGGGWTHGSKTSGGGEFFHMGFALINVEYRFSQVATAPAAIEDSRCALKYVKMHAKELNIDPNRIVLEGGSAGGHLVLMTGLLGNDRRFDGNCPGTPDMRVAAIVDDYGPSDLTPSLWTAAGGRKSVMGWLGAKAGDQAFVASVSPITYVQHDSPPTIIFQGSEDHTVPTSQSQTLEDKLTAAGVPTELVFVQGAGHGRFTHDQVAMEEGRIKEFLKKIGFLK